MNRITKKIPQAEVMRIFGMSRTWLFKLRKKHGLKTYSFPESHIVYYDIDELEALLQPTEPGFDSHKE